MSKLANTSYVIMMGWMKNELHLTGDMMFAYAWLWNAFKLNQDRYFILRETVEQLSAWYDSDIEKVITIIEELDRLKAIELDRYLDKSNNEIMAKIKINEPREKIEE